MTKAAKNGFVVIGGELKDLAGGGWKDAEAREVIGRFENYCDAYDCWKARAQSSVDDACTKFVIEPA